MTNSSDGLIRTALRGNEETASRLRRTQLIGVLLLAIATLATPMVRVTEDDSDADRPLSAWAAIGWIGQVRDDSGEIPSAFGWLTVVLYLAILFVIVAVILAVVIAVNRAGAARAAAGVVAGFGAIATLLCWLALVGETPGDFAELHPTWGVLLPLGLGLWTANMLETDA
ncbi:hypothetical protein FB381_3461 [Nocardioides albertanoniae]|uniref:Uncharacterized protein n=1 Tax=Nocardioides albertanoniae TaxID=1175486 RepID=A0A543AAC9_9ACTN|nr:hypothetical protein [Nocardioides albertanoniae]TQL69551.1 hypothetical protein FB381_3461 [Nocardioides albertanoniae]